MMSAALNPEDTEHSITQENKKEEHLNSTRDLISPDSIILGPNNPSLKALQVTVT